ncbi:MAG: zinc ribbon domain-containing protein [Acidimicrobiia bacterium]
MELVSLADLLDLQELDLQIDHLLEKRQSLPELEAYRQTHTELEELKSELEQAEAALKELELALDKASGELELLETKLNEHETRLYAGGMSARETEHMRLEVQSLRGQKGTMEEKVLRIMEEVDPAREVVQELKARGAEMETEKSRLEASIREQWRTIDAELARKEERKKAAVEPISEDLLELYENLRRIKEGVAVAAFDHGVCGGCHMALSPAEQEEAFSTEIPRCVHCRRILVA